MLAQHPSYSMCSDSSRVTSTYLFPFKEDLCRYDFEVEPEDEYMCNFGTPAGDAAGLVTPAESDESARGSPKTS